jgi:hypothetical protein
MERSVQSQETRIYRALKAGRKLTSRTIAKLTKSTAPATRISCVRRRYNLDLNRVWVKRNGKRFLEWSLA